MLKVLLTVGLLGAVLLPGVGTANADDALPHLRLTSTSPAADTTLSSSPSEIRLHFSEAPQLRGTTVRLADASEALVPSSDTMADEADPTQILIRPEAPLAPGRYTVHWRVIAQDGHTQRGTFDFTVRAANEG